MDIFSILRMELFFIILIIYSVLRFFTYTTIFINKIKKEIFNKDNLDKFFKLFEFIGNDYSKCYEEFTVEKGVDTIYDNEYRVYFTGNEKINYMFMNVVFDKQHDFITSFLINKVYKHKDYVSIEAKLNTTEKFGVLAFVKDIMTLEYFESNIDVKYLGKFIKSKFNYLNVYSNNTELNENILKNLEITNFIENYSKYIEFIHVSNKMFNVHKVKDDQSTYIRIKINLAENNNKRLKYSELFDFIIKFLNIISKSKFSKAQTQSIDNDLNEFQKLLDKEANKEKSDKVLDDLRKKKEQKIKNMSPRTRAKYLDKEQKKKFKNKVMRAAK